MIKVAFKKNKTGIDVLRRLKLVNENTLRKRVADSFKSLRPAQKVHVINITVRNLGSFPLVPAAKITAQEIFKFMRRENVSLKEIIVHVDEIAVCAVFNKQIVGYIHHMQNKLGLGPYVTVDLIIEIKGGIVLIERSNPPFGWALPGGFVDYGESLEHAAKREAKEETHLDLVHLKQFHTYSDPRRDPRFQTVSTVFIAQGKGRAQSGDDAQNLKIVPIKDLFKNRYPFDHKKVLKDYVKFKDS